MSHKHFLALAAVLAAALSPSAAEASTVPDVLYVTNGALDGDPDTANVARFRLDSAGRAAFQDTEPAGASARGMVFTPASTFAYVASSDTKDGGSIDRYRVAADGSLTRLGATPTPGPFGIAIHPNGRTVYVANFDTDHLTAFRVEANGDLTAIDDVRTPPHPKGIAITPDGRFIYAANGAPGDVTRGGLTGFAITSTGAFGSQVDTEQLGATGHRVVISPNGRFAYATSQERGNPPDLYGFRIGSTGTLTPVPNSPIEAGVWAEGAAISPDGTRLYVASLTEVGAPEEDGQIRAFALDPTTGGLSALAANPFGLDPVDMAFGLDGRHLYAADFAASTVTVFETASSGTLTPVQTVESEGQNPGFQSVIVRAG